MAKVINNTYVVTNKVRMSYAHVLEAVVPMSGGEPVYNCSFIIPKSDTETVDAIKEAIKNAVNVGKDRVFKGKTANMHYPLRDGDDDRPDDENYKNCWFINAKSKKRPTIVDTSKRTLESGDEVYSGMYVNAVLSFYPYSNNGNKGIACGLGNMQKVEDGPRLGGGMPDLNTTFNFNSESDSGLPF